MKNQSPTGSPQPGTAPPALGPSPAPRDLDRELKELEILNKQQELDTKKQESAQKSQWWSRWNNPVVLAVLAALVGYLGTLITWSLARSDEKARYTRTLELEEKKQQATEKLEQQKFQGTLILDAMKTGEGPDKTKRAAVNLLLLADAKLVTFDEEARKKLTAWSEGKGGVGPGLPSPHPEPLEGTARSEAAKALNRLKNRYESPSESDIDKAVSLAAMLAPEDDVDRFDHEKAARISGFVVNVVQGGITSANLNSKDPEKRDTHIEIALTNDAPRIQRVLVVVTWRLREQMKAKGIDWSTKALQEELKGKQIEVTGWLFLSTPHLRSAENTNPGNPRNWRATAWEIHPVTEIKVLAAPSPK